MVDEYLVFYSISVHIAHLEWPEINTLNVDITCLMSGEMSIPGAAMELPPPSQQQSLKPATIYDVSVLDERRKTLQALLKKGHLTVAPLREPKLILHSHLPHV